MAHCDAELWRSIVRFFFFFAWLIWQVLFITDINTKFLVFLCVYIYFVGCN